MEMTCAGCGTAATLGEGCDATLIQCDERSCYVHTWCTTCNKPTKLRRAPLLGDEPKQKCVCLSAKVKDEAYKVLWDTVRAKLKEAVDGLEEGVWKEVLGAIQKVVETSPDVGDDPDNNDEWVKKVTRRGALFMMERLQARMLQVTQEREKKLKEQRLESREWTMLVSVAEEMG